MIPGIVQPDLLRVDKNIILTRKTSNFEFALKWYQDPQTIRLVCGVDETPYSLQEVYYMYNEQNRMSELYFIEYLIDGAYTPIGDVALSKNDLPIVIGEERFRSKGIGKKVLLTLIERARLLKFDTMGVKEVFNYNLASQNLFKSVGFVKARDTKNGVSFIMYL